MALGALGGEVFDPAALSQVKSFCVDLSNLESGEAAAVKEFLAKASEPKGVLDRLPWRLVDDCTKADAVAWIYFAPVVPFTWTAGPNPVGNPRAIHQFFDPVLLLYDRASIRLFYRAQGQVLYGRRADVLASPFALLAKDLKKIHRHT